MSKKVHARAHEANQKTRCGLTRCGLQYRAYGEGKVRSTSKDWNATCKNCIALSIAQSVAARLQPETHYKIGATITVRKPPRFKP